MINVAVLALDSVPLSSLALPVDILNAAGVLWNRIAQVPEEASFKVSIVSPGKRPVTCHQSLTISPDFALEEIAPPDVLIIGGLGGLEDFATKHREVIDYLVYLHSRGTTLASICTGAFLLAETGLLDGKAVSTHWGMSGALGEMYPSLRVTSENIVVDEGSLMSSGGTTAGADLALHIVRKYCGHEMADRCARVLLLDPNRSSQAPYEVMRIPIDHGDSEIIKVQRWVEQNYNTVISVERLAEVALLSRRTFERRFKKATGDSPLRYLQRFRIEKAKQYLETSNHTFESITSRVGYEDTSTFRRMFQKGTGLPPSVYREKFLTKRMGSLVHHFD